MDEDSKTYFCQIESFNAAKDYFGEGENCLRLIGVEPTDFRFLEIADRDVTTFLIDIDINDLISLFLKSYPDPFPMGMILNLLEGKDADEGWGADENEIWLKIEIAVRGANEEEEPLSYMYPTFSEDAPTTICLKHMEMVAPPLMAFSDALPSFSDEHESKWVGESYRSSFVFDAFHVGQGMCSLVHNEELGILIDIGAGTPVTRASYSAYQHTQNGMWQTVEKLSYVDAVISHGDSDHWRLLAWDAKLLAKVGNVIVPKSAKYLAFKDKKIRKKLLRMDSRSLFLPSGDYLHLYRSQPARWDRNGDCLIALFEDIAGDLILAPGDYVYKRFSSDMSLQIQQLSLLSYRALIVPHHGDEASAKDIPEPKDSGSIAFFSAGTHRTYQHPRKVSVKNHKKKFKIVKNPECLDIVGVRL